MQIADEESIIRIEYLRNDLWEWFPGVVFVPSREILAVHSSL